MKDFYSNIRQETGELALLFEISQLLATAESFSESVKLMMNILAEHMGLLRGTVAIYDTLKDEVFIHDAVGLTSKEKERGKYKPGEGITGKVFQTGKPIAIEKISESPLFLNKTGARRKNSISDFSFICVPIKASDKSVIGTISADRLYHKDNDLKDDLRLLSVIASMISRTVENHKKIHEENSKLAEENSRLHLQLCDKFNFSNIMIGNSNPMRHVFELVICVAKSNTTVFINGESGVGKELVASAIHFNSERADKPFIKVNCGALPENLIESELFGHEKGSFTGAMNSRKGRFETAHGGTLFLDEVGELPLSTQVKLLRVLQEHEFEKLGSSETTKTDVRIIAATNRNLEEMVENGTFRKDLYYRLNVFPIFVPPLRERKSDIIQLADYFLEKYVTNEKKRNLRISTEAINMLMDYSWHGNVRELENCMERAVLMSSDGVIRPQHLPPSLQIPTASSIKTSGTLDAVLSQVEKDMLSDALKTSKGNMTKAAELLGISERIMGLRVKKYDIDIKSFK